MKRSQVNELVKEAEVFFDSKGFKLPPWSRWSPEQWKRRIADTAEVRGCGLGWDLTDFGRGDFANRGLVLFTIRNGNQKAGSKPYAEKIMIVREEQETPFHFHWSKMEDIINRGGGNLVIELFNATDDESTDDTPVTATVDGIAREVAAGGAVVLEPGESICLPRRMYHRFCGQRGGGTVLVGEVSAVNDDSSDNRFLEELGRFPTIDEDCAPYRLLVSDYERFL